MSSELKRWNLFMPPELLEKTQKIAKKQHISASDVVRKALITYIAAVEKAELAKTKAQEVADVA